MQGTVLILDGIATNRIILKVQLCASYFHVVQSDRVEGIEDLARRAKPDLIITSMSLPDGRATDLHARLQKDEATAGIPIIAICAENDRNSRLSALAAGIDEVLSHPADDVFLQARIRSLIRARGTAEEFRLRNEPPQALGFCEPSAKFVLPARVAIVAGKHETGSKWRYDLAARSRYNYCIFAKNDMPEILSGEPSDLYVIEVDGDADQTAMRLMADLRARAATRHAAIIAVVQGTSAVSAADALDRGAHDVMTGEYCGEELILRIDAQLQRKANSDSLRQSVENGLRAAIRDPMTGLYNRNYAIPRLSRIARDANKNGSKCAVMLADLDHFKRINDRFGHGVGDAVLVEAATRMRQSLRPSDMIARIGGEEFLIALPDTMEDEARMTANRLCQQINEKPFRVLNGDYRLDVTISIGVVILSPDSGPSATEADAVLNVIQRADRALYRAKGSGRNKVTMFRSAA